MSHKRSMACHSGRAAWAVAIVLVKGECDTLDE